MPLQQQLINGKLYDLYSPAWKAAMAAQNATPTNAAAMTSLLSPSEQVAQSNAELSRQSAADQANRDRELAAKTEADRAAESAAALKYQQETDAANRASASALAAQNATAHSSDLTLESGLSDKNAAAAAARSQAAREAMLAKVPMLMQSLTGDTGSTAPIVGDNAQSARDLAFARAKDKIGEVQRGAMTALREGMSSRGIAPGSGIESGAMASLVGEGEGQLSDVVSGQATSEAQRANSVADAQRADALTRRSQNLNIGQSILSLLGSSAY